MNVSRARQRYTAEFKSDAVKLVVDHGYSCSEAARRLGIAPNNVVRWVREHREKHEAAEQGLPEPQNLHAEIRRLRKENERLRMEREILKKAAAFFANESD